MTCVHFLCAGSSCVETTMTFDPTQIPAVSRRHFLQGVLGSTASMALIPSAFAAQRHGYRPPLMQLRVKTSQINIGKTAVNFSGHDRTATTVNQSIPGPILRWKEGQNVTIRVTNHLAEPTSIHWHGILLPFQMDGVPGISFPGIAPGKTFTYRFPVKQSGTYWYHSHSGFQEQIGHRSEEHTSELQSLMRISYAVFCLKKKKHTNANNCYS